jgi:hypothetical protein
MDSDAFEVHKQNSEDNTLAWVRSLLITDYGEVVRVIDTNTVTVRPLVQHGPLSTLYTVRLLDVGSSKLVEKSVQPKEHDQVLILFLRMHNEDMFFDPEERAANDPNGRSTIIDDKADSYNMFSGIGILAATAKARAATTIRYGEDSVGAFINFQTKARLMAAFKDAVSVVFDVPVGEGGAEPDDAPLSLLLGKHVPLGAELRAPVDIAASVDAPVSMELAAGLSVDAKAQKIGIKNNSGSLVAALDSTITDCVNLVSALNALSSTESQTAITTGGSGGAAALALVIKGLLSALNTALGSLGFGADKSAVDAVLK